MGQVITEHSDARVIARWMVLALAVNFFGQIVRLGQSDPALWLVCDYAGRIAGLLVLAASPRVRERIFRQARLKLTALETIVWCVAITIGYQFFNAVLARIAAFFPSGYGLGAYPELHGWLYLFDMSFGLLLVATHEELLFRRAARAAFAGLGEGAMMLTVAALLFGMFHWATGVPNMISATVFGVLAMLFYRRAGAIWPVIAVHYLQDVIGFW